MTARVPIAGDGACARRDGTAWLRATLAAAAATAAAMPTAFAAPGRDGRASAQSVRVIEASYGASGGWSGETRCDVARAVAAVCDGRRTCAVPVSPDLCPDGADVPGLIRTLAIRFSCRAGGPVRDIGAEAPGQALLRCDG